MRRLVKALAFAIALPVLLAGLAVAVFFSLSDAQYRWTATRVVSALLDSPVEFRGPFSKSILPTACSRRIPLEISMAVIPVPLAASLSPDEFTGS